MTLSPMHRFHTFAVVALTLLAMAAFSPTSATAQQCCSYTVTVSPQLTCPIRVETVLISGFSLFADWTWYTPGTSNTKVFVPCPGVPTSFCFTTATGSQTVPSPGGATFRVPGGCCVAVTIQPDAAGCMQVNIGPAPGPC